MNIEFEKKLKSYYKIKRNGVDVGHVLLAEEFPKHLDLFLSKDQMKILEEYQGKFIYLEEIMLKHKYRGNGWFKSIMNALHSLLKNEGYESVILIPTPLLDGEDKRDTKTRWKVLIRSYKKLDYGIMASFFSTMDHTEVGVVLKRELRE